MSVTSSPHTKLTNANAVLRFCQKKVCSQRRHNREAGCDQSRQFQLEKRTMSNVIDFYWNDNERFKRKAQGTNRRKNRRKLALI